MEKKTVFILAMLWILTANVHADITIFDSNSVISGTYDTVVVKGDGTVVEMTGGTINKLITMDNSTFNMTGASAYISSTVYSYDTSTLNLSSGEVSFLYAYGNSKVFYSGDFQTSGNDQEFNDSSKAVVSDSADFSGSRFICRENSFASIEGGTLMALRLGSGSERAGIVVSHGTISELQVSAYLPLESMEISIVGYSLNKSPYGGGSGNGEVTGFWNDDTPFTINLGGRGTYPHIILYDGVLPALCTNSPESDTTGDCKVNMADLTKMAFEWLLDGTM